MGRVTGSWLSGPQIGPGAGVDNEYRGQDLGLPASGPGSLATGWPRVMGLLVDWLIAGGLALIFVGGNLLSSSLAGAQLVIWFVMGVFAVTLFGFTPGQYVMGMRVARVDYGPERNTAEATGKEPPAAVGVVRAFFRQLLMVFLVPALINDYNGRAMHDRATGTAIVRTR
ncbi:RDD family protein [Gordonia paraffinivorans]|uniref:RDD family protein n=1 Tax=Gordonia paraffinivorans TaxID=175628 RepID=UPI000D6125E8|nr:RDD family protein [Gordonia paraffinivorans]MBY4574040.1 RDD family protein [Gordonia paraffinivorans]PWD42202.1 RDD family protein [Gordonia paraffinivorans]